MIIPFAPSGGIQPKISQQIGQSCENRPIELNEQEINDLRLNGGWLSVLRFSQLSAKPLSTVKDRCLKKKYANLQRVDESDRRRPYQIHITSLPEPVLGHVLRQLRGEKEVTEEDRARRDAAFQARTATAAHNVEKAYVRNSILKEYRAHLAGAGRGELLARKQEFCDRFNRGWITDLLEEREEVGSVSWKTLDRWQDQLDAAEGDSWGLAPKYGQSRGLYSVSEFEAQALLRHAVNPNGLPYATIIAEARKELLRAGYEMRLSDATYQRWLKRHGTDNGYLIDMVRHGEKALNDLYIPPIRRDLDKIEVGDILVSDGHTLNFTMLDPLTGRPKRMTLVVVFDFKSSMPVGVEFSATENTAAIASAYRRSIRMLGFVPYMFYTDNGRAFKASFFTKRVDMPRNIMGEKAFTGLFDRLKPYGFKEHRNALPYHGQSKPVERFFGSMEEFSRRMPTYLGNSIENRVASERRNEKFARDLRERWSGGAQPDVRGVYAMLVEWFAEYANRPMSSSAFYAGRKPIDVFRESMERVRAADGFAGRMVDDAALRYLMMAEATRTIRNGKVKLFGRDYYADELVGYRPGERSVVLRYDLFDEAMDGRVLIYDERGEELICEASSDVLVGHHPAARTLGGAEDVARLDGALGVQRMIKGEAMKMARAVTSAGYFDAMRAEEMRSVPTMKEVEERKRKQVVAKTGTDGESELGRKIQQAMFDSLGTQELLDQWR